MDLNSVGIGGGSGMGDRNVNALHNVGPRDVVCAIDAFNAGNFDRLSRMLDAIELRAGIASSVIAKTKSKVSRNGFDVVCLDCEEGDEELARNQQEYVRRFFDNVRVTSANCLDREEGFEGLVSDIMDARGKGYSIFLNEWDVSGDDGLRLKCYHLPLHHFRKNKGRLEYIGDKPMTNEGEVLHAGAANAKWFCAVHTQPLGPPTAMAWIGAAIADRDWLVYGERFGLPFVDVSTGAEVGTTAWQMACQFARDFLGGRKGVRSNDTDVQLISPSNSGSLPFPELIEQKNREISALWRGNDLGTMSRGGERPTGASVQGDETEDLDADNARWAAGQINRGLVPTILAYEFGAEAPILVELQLQGIESYDMASDVATLGTLVDRGMPISQQWVAERHGISLANDDEELLEPAAQTTPATLASVSGSAFNEQAQGRALLLERSLAQLTGAAPEWLAPARDAILRIVEDARNGMTPEDMEAAALSLADSAPQLFNRLEPKVIADVLEEAMGTAWVRGVSDYIESEPEAFEAEFSAAEKSGGGSAGNETAAVLTPKTSKTRSE